MHRYSNFLHAKRFDKSLAVFVSVFTEARSKLNRGVVWREPDRAMVPIISRRG